MEYTREEVEKQAVSLAKSISGLREEITIDSEFRNHLGFDERELGDYFNNIEDIYGFEFSDEEADSLYRIKNLTIRNVSDYVYRYLIK